MARSGLGKHHRPFPLSPGHGDGVFRCAKRVVLLGKSRTLLWATKRTSILSALIHAGGGLGP